jgi:hypothetical protein
MPTECGAQALADAVTTLQTVIGHLELAGAHSDLPGMLPTGDEHLRQLTDQATALLRDLVALRDA